MRKIHFFNEMNPIKFMARFAVFFSSIIRRKLKPKRNEMNIASRSLMFATKYFHIRKKKITDFGDFGDFC